MRQGVAQEQSVEAVRNGEAVRARHVEFVPMPRIETPTDAARVEPLLDDLQLLRGDAEAAADEGLLQ